ncbi:hypothetical protein JTE90_023447 [Oedothorax gibbosus]|uniref:DNA-directed DNA polymerase n=1 Tax=Oedothorax gibbosus TaxID=931172 RepID=A0AAV6U151_9ARAC|nr:hypothetical protein JTE90_023447 [Oedothorax gibbosus]
MDVSENDSYIGVLPDQHYYMPEMMSSEDREKFMAWYEERKLEPFDFAKEFVDYCRSDVDMLRRCCINFRQEFSDVTGVDPFQYITIASACMASLPNQSFAS